ncbi:hypothetical protein ACQ4PT_016876 [Festuca glaucescens]
MAGKKKGAPGQGTVRSLLNASERARNRASPLAVVKLYDHLSIEQKGAIVDMDLESMLDIKCHSLHNPVINWLAPLYDKHTRVFVIPGRGRTPLNVESVYHTLALPRGDQNVRYVIDTDIENRIGPLLFPGHSSTPKITEVFTILKDMVDRGRVFKQMWMMYLTCTLLPPTTSNKLSSRVYPILDNIDVVHHMNICQFVCDKLHEELSADRVSGACLFHLQLLYVYSLDVGSLNIVLPEGRCVANRWSKENIDLVLNADLKRDGSGYGNLELKPQFAVNVNWFGDPAAFE